MTTKPKEKKYTVRESVEVQHQFTLEEYKSKSEQLAQLMVDVSLKKEAVKASAASAKAVIKELESQCSELGNQLRLGAETRTVPSDCEFDRKKGEKTYRYADGPNKGKVIRKQAMSEDEFDMLPLPPSEDTLNVAPATAATGEPIMPAMMHEQAADVEREIAEAGATE